MILKAIITLALADSFWAKLDDPAALWQSWSMPTRSVVSGNALLCRCGCHGCGQGGILLCSAGIVISCVTFRYQWIVEFFNNSAGCGGATLRVSCTGYRYPTQSDALASIVIDRFIGLMVLPGSNAGITRSDLGPLTGTPGAISAFICR